MPSFLRRFNFGTRWGSLREADDEEEGDEEEDEEVGEEEVDWRVYDEDTLLESMHARRTASERELAGLAERCGIGMERRAKSSDSLGMLFTPTE